MKQLNINGKTYTLDNISGTVAESSKNLETKVGGGGGAINKGSGVIAPVFSLTIVHNQIFLIDQQGRERSLSIEGMDVACRAGNQITVTRLTHQDGKEEYIAAANYTTQTTSFNVMAINRLFVPDMKRLLKPALISIGVSILLFWIGGIFIFLFLLFAFTVATIGFGIYLFYTIFVASPKLGREFIAQYRIEDYS